MHFKNKSMMLCFSKGHLGIKHKTRNEYTLKRNYIPIESMEDKMEVIFQRQSQNRNGKKGKRKQEN